MSNQKTKEEITKEIEELSDSDIPIGATGIDDSGLFTGIEKYRRRKWLKAAAIRACRTCAQTAVATIGTGAVLSEVNWLHVVSASVLAGILSILTAIAGLPEVDK